MFDASKFAILTNTGTLNNALGGLIENQKSGLLLNGGLFVAFGGGVGQIVGGQIQTVNVDLSNVVINNAGYIDNFGRIINLATLNNQSGGVIFNGFLNNPTGLITNTLER